MGRSEQDILNQIGRPRSDQEPESRIYEELRRAFEGLDDSGRKEATLRAYKYWKSLSPKRQQDSVRLISGLWRYHFSANHLKRTEKLADLLLHQGRRTARPVIEAEGLLGRAMVLLAQGANDEAIQIFELSRALFAARKANRYDSIRASSSLAEAHRRAGDRSSALAVLQRARRDCLEIEDIPSLGSVSQGLGILHLEAGNLVSAIECFTFVRKSSELLRSNRRLMRAMLGLAMAYSRKGDLESAEHAATVAMREAKKAQLPREMALAHEYLGEVAARRGDWGASLKWYSLVNKFAMTPAAADIRIELHRKLAELWLSKRNVRYAQLHVKRGLRLTGDAEDLLALRRLDLELKWEVSPGPGVLEELIQLAAESKRMGLGYEYFLASRAISKAASESGRSDLAQEWWGRVSSIAVLSGAESLLETWRAERESASTAAGEHEDGASSELWRELPKIDLSPYGIVTRSRVMIEQGALIGKVASTRIPVLLTGESGTGKELFASLVHELSLRRDAPFLAVNCAAIPAELIESELFGHRRGAFTGATADKDGLFKTAHHGTIFLDEIGEMPPSIQSKLLRVLETGEIRRVGDTVSQNVDVRIVAATNLDLKAAVRKGAFRRDLYYRLRGLEAHLPPLRQRLVDIPILAEHFVKMANRDLEKDLWLPPGTKQWLIGHEWPGNVRELRLSIERAAAVAPPSGPLRAYHFVHSEIGVERSSLTQELEEIERARVKNALEVTGWNVTAAADLLGLTRTTLSSRLKRLGIRRPKD